LQELGQLSSPGASVLSLYSKILEYDAQNAWCKKLGSIEILLSLPPGSALALPFEGIENASRVNIRKGYYSWKRRCDEDADNLALFYFCGHGFQKKHHFLLADDFGEIPEDAWDGAFDFDNTRDAFYSCNANTPIFLVDACREVNIEMLKKDITVKPLDDPSLFNPEESKNHLTLKSTASGKAAYGKKDKPSYFVQAIISGLDGLVARQDANDEWLVDTSELGANINTLLELINPGQSTRQPCQTTCGVPASILRRRETPNAWLEVSCQPAEALSLAELSCVEDSEGEITTFIRAPMADTWKLNII
jgi:Caspase domain